MESSLTMLLDALYAGQPVIVPTDTVYGLVADGRNTQAVEALYTAKKRPAQQPSQLLVSSLEQAQTYGQMDDAARDMATQHWPGATTLIVPATETAQRTLAPQAVGPDGTIGLRVPHTPLLITLLQHMPLLASSANKAGVPYRHDFAMICQVFPNLVAFKGEKPNGQASSIWQQHATGFKQLR